MSQTFLFLTNSPWCYKLVSDERIVVITTAKLLMLVNIVLLKTKHEKTSIYRKKVLMRC